jgi:CO/xanthine dehydrogenase FAD-binding subunit
MLALDAVFDLAGPDGERSIAAEDFFKGLFETDLGPEEVLMHVRISPQKGARASYRKCRHPASGYAAVGVVVVPGDATVRLSDDGESTPCEAFGKKFRSSSQRH